MWTWRPDPVRDAYLGEHLIDRRPVLPAVMMLSMAAHAALATHPGSHVTALRDVRIDAPLYADTPNAGCRITTHALTPGTVRAELRSDVIAPDGRVLVHDRLHCRVEVDLGELAAPPPAPPVPDLPELEDDPAVRPDVAAQLSGVWRTLHHPAADTTRARARCRPHADPHSVFAQLPIPALVLDSTMRLFGFPPLPDGRQIMAVPGAAARIDFYTNDTDLVLAERFPQGIDLSFDVAARRAVAAADGRILFTVTDLTIHIVDAVAPDIPYQEWHP